jgi:hypothetical protein
MLARSSAESVPRAQGPERMASAAGSAVRDLTDWRVLPRSRRARWQSATRNSTAHPRPESRRGGTTTRTSRGSRRSGAHAARRRAPPRARTGRRRIRTGRCRGRAGESVERPRDASALGAVRFSTTERGSGTAIPRKRPDRAAVRMGCARDACSLGRALCFTRRGRGCALSDTLAGPWRAQSEAERSLHGTTNNNVGVVAGEERCAGASSSTEKAVLRELSVLSAYSQFPPCSHRSLGAPRVNLMLCTGNTSADPSTRFARSG